MSNKKSHKAEEKPVNKVDDKDLAAPNAPVEKTEEVGRDYKVLEPFQLDGKPTELGTIVTLTDETAKLLGDKVKLADATDLKDAKTLAESKIAIPEQGQGVANAEVGEIKTPNQTDVSNSDQPVEEQPVLRKPLDQSLYNHSVQNKYVVRESFTLDGNPLEAGSVISLTDEIALKVQDKVEPFRDSTELNTAPTFADVADRDKAPGEALNGSVGKQYVAPVSDVVPPRNDAAEQSAKGVNPSVERPMDDAVGNQPWAGNHTV